MNLRFVWEFAKFNGISWVKKSPANIIANVVSPLCLLFIIFFVSKGALLSFAIVGGTIAIISANTLSTTGQSAMFRLEFKMQELLVATKVNIMEYMLGYVLSSLFFCAPGIVFFTVMSLIFHLFTLERFIITLAVVLMLSIATSSIALFVGGKIRRTIGMWAISGILSSLMTLIPPTFYPYTALPTQILYILAISPVTPAAVLLQGAYGLEPMNYIMLPVLIIEVIVYALIVKYIGKWQDK